MGLWVSVRGEGALRPTVSKDTVAILGSCGGESECAAGIIRPAKRRRRMAKGRWYFRTCAHRRGNDPTEVISPVSNQTMESGAQQTD